MHRLADLRGSMPRASPAQRRAARCCRWCRRAGARPKDPTSRSRHDRRHRRSARAPSSTTPFATRFATPRPRARARSSRDPDFADWPLNDRRWSSRSALGRCASASRHRAQLRRAGAPPPRFVEWRRQWSHVVRCRSDPELEAEQIPTMLLVPGQVVLAPGRPRPLSRHRVEPGGRLSERRETIDALLQRSVEAFPVTTLGL